MFENRPLTDEEATEQLTLLHVIAAVVLLLLGSAATLWLTGVTWLVHHHVLVAATAHPQMVIPHSAGAGLDWPRITIAACALAALLAYLGSAIRHNADRRRYR